MVSLEISRAQCIGIPISHILAPEPSFGVVHVASAGGAIPGTVGVSSQAAFCTGFAIDPTSVQGQLRNGSPGTHVELLPL